MTSSDPLAPHAPPTTARALLEHPGVRTSVRLATGEAGLDRPIAHPRIQKSGLVLAGHMHGIVPTRVQILGETEVSYLETLEPDVQRARIDALFALGLSCVIVTRGVAPLAVVEEAAARTGTPLCVSELKSSATIARIHQALDRLLAPREQRHGVMVEIHGIGTLLLGPSGIGKSECALFLVERGHRLVADDQVCLTRMPDGTVSAAPAPLLKHHLEIRGLGILNIAELFGATAVWDEATVDLVAELCPWRDDEHYERLGLDDVTESILGVPISKLRIPIRPGRDMAVILEVAARNELMKASGRHSARDFARRLSQKLGVEDPGKP